MIIGSILFGYKVGELRWSAGPTKDTIIYVKSDTIRDTLTDFGVTTEYLDPGLDTISLLKYCIDNELYGWLIPTKDSIQIQYQQVDTLGILKDWLTERGYELTLFSNDTIGELIIYPKIQYNRLKSLTYDYVPVTKIITKTPQMTNTIDPFIGVGINTNSTLSAQAGVFFRSGWGIGYQYLNDFKGNQGHGVILTYKLRLGRKI